MPEASHTTVREVDACAESDLLKAQLGLLSDQFQQQPWLRDGFCASARSLHPDLVAELRQRVENLTEGRFERGRAPYRYVPPQAGRQNHMAMYSHAHWADSLIAKLAHSEQLAAIAARLLGVESIRLWGTSVIYKYGAADAVNDVIWHRDMTSWQCVSAPRLMTFWIALDDTNPANGCLEFARASHRVPFSGNDDDLGLFEMVAVPLQAGQISAHHCLTGHRSNSNRSQGPRRGLTIHMMDADLHYVPGSPSDGHINVCLLGKTTPSDFECAYFPRVFTRQA